MKENEMDWFDRIFANGFDRGHLPYYAEDTYFNFDFHQWTIPIAYAATRHALFSFESSPSELKILVGRGKHSNPDVGFRLGPKLKLLLEKHLEPPLTVVDKTETQGTLILEEETMREWWLNLQEWRSQAATMF